MSPAGPAMTHTAAGNCRTAKATATHRALPNWIGAGRKAERQSRSGQSGETMPVANSPTKPGMAASSGGHKSYSSRGDADSRSANSHDDRHGNRANHHGGKHGWGTETMHVYRQKVRGKNRFDDDNAGNPLPHEGSHSQGWGAHSQTEARMSDVQSQKLLAQAEVQAAAIIRNGHNKAAELLQAAESAARAVWAETTQKRQELNVATGELEKARAQLAELKCTALVFAKELEKGQAELAELKNAPL
jgi:hypothetical protein